MCVCIFYGVDTAHFMRNGSKDFCVNFSSFFYIIIQSIGNCFGARVCHSIFLFFASHSSISLSVLLRYSQRVQCLVLILDITFFSLSLQRRLCAHSLEVLLGSGLVLYCQLVRFCFAFLFHTSTHFKELDFSQCIQVSQSLSPRSIMLIVEKKRIKNIELI